MATEARDLHTGVPLWAAGPHVALPTTPLARDARTDVLVVGAGISGALTADLLAEAGLRVTVVDRRGPALGSTLASTSLLLYALDTPLHRMARALGEEAALRAWRRSRLALAALEDRIRRLGLRADVHRRSTLYLEGDLLDAGGLAAEGRARRAAGFECAWLTAADVAARFGIAPRAALWGHGGLVADPRRLALGLLDQAARRGARFQWPVDVVRVEPERDRVIAHTAEGPTLTARHLVWATGYEFPDRVPAAGHRIVSTWVIATGPGTWKGPGRRALIWEASDPYLYLRSGPGGSIIAGGEDEPFEDEDARDALLPEKTATLERRVTQLIPGIQSRAAHAWTASFGETASGLPHIGAVPGSPRCYALMGYGGNGITFSMMGAQILRGLITEEPDADTDLFAFPRE
ncbi:MAG: FAD-dependent oxidoreductase [Gemmatimonadota bacterium]